MSNLNKRYFYYTAIALLLNNDAFASHISDEAKRTVQKAGIDTPVVIVPNTPAAQSPGAALIAPQVIRKNDTGNPITDRKQFIISWIIESGAQEKCTDAWGWQFKELHEVIKNYPAEHLQAVTTWMKESGAWDKCVNGKEIKDLLITLKDYPVERLQADTSWMKESGAWDKCTYGAHIICLLATLKGYPKECLEAVTTRMKESGAWDKCTDGYHIENLLFEFKDYPAEHLKVATTWVNKSGALDKCTKVRYIRELLNVLKDYPVVRLQAVTTWMKESGAWDKCTDGGDIEWLLQALKDFDLEIFTNKTKELRRTIEIHDLSIYVLCLGTKFSDERILDLVDQLLRRQTTRERTLDLIVRWHGEDSDVAQHYLTLAAGYDNQNNPNGFLAVHQEMMKKAGEKVDHHVRKCPDGTQINLQYLCEDRPERPIHMPLNVWERMFDQLQSIPPEDLQLVLGAESLSLLLALRENKVLTDLLDPKDSLVAKKDVSYYSYMLRAILKHIQEESLTNPNAIHGFVQLLVNVQTCPMGKRNGIAQSFRFLGQNRVLDESLLGSASFKEEILRFFKEDLRRFREATLSSVMRSITNDAQADPHDLYYLRGIIGHEVGLMFVDETPTIDLNAGGVDQALRKMSKQKLLDLFHQYYTVEEIINRIHTMLNNGAIAIENQKDNTNLTVKILNAFFEWNALKETKDPTKVKYNPEFIVLNQNKKPIGLTPKAAKILLEHLGFLVRDS